MNKASEQAIQDLIDREAIRRCLTEVARGVDRQDPELVRAAFHPDARDDHGEYIGGVDGFIEYANGMHRKYWDYTAHTLSLPTIEIVGDEAHSEVHATCWLRRKGGSEMDLSIVRYVDRLERRHDGVWRIADRVTCLEWQGTLVGPEGGSICATDIFIHGTWDKGDISFRRPLTVDRESKAWNRSR